MRSAFAKLGRYFPTIVLCGLAAVAVGLVLWEFGRSPEKGGPASTRTRALRRAYDGAPPVIPHVPFGPDCTFCHTAEGKDLSEMGFAPANPHLHTAGMSASSRCRQCHVFARTDRVLVASNFRGLPQVVRRGERAYPDAPPTIPHPVFMRESCNACHAGPAVRPEIRCTHPERMRCLQCHARTPAGSAR
jgi:cytochrome c-type protein NapB